MNFINSISKFLVFAAFFLFLGLNSNATTWYSLNGQTNPSVLTNWTLNTNGTGGSPVNFTTAGDLFIFQTGHTYTTTAAWNVTGTVQINGTLNIGNNGPHAWGYLIVNGGILNFGSNQIVNITNNCTLSGTSQITGNNAARTLNISGTLTTSTGSTPTITGISMTVAGLTTLNSTLTFSSTTGTKTFNDVLLASGATWNSTAAETYDISGNLSMSDGIISGTLAGRFNVARSLLITVGTSNTINAGTLTITGNTSIDGILIFGSATGIKTFSNVTIGSGGSWTNNAAETYAINGNLSMSGGTFTGTSTGIINVSGTFDITAGSTNTINNGTLTITGITTVAGSLDFSSTTGNKIFNNNIIINSGGTWSSSGNEAFTISGNLQNDGTLTSGTGIYTLSGNTKTISGTSGVPISIVTMSGTYTNNVTAAIGFAINTSLGGTGTLTQGSGSILKIGGTFATGTLVATVNPNTVYYTSTTAAQTLRATTNTYHHLIIDKSGQIATLGVNTTCNGDLTIAAGTLQLSTFNCIVSGTTSITGTLDDNSATGTNTFAGISMTGGTINTSAATTINATTLSVPSGTNTISGTLGNITFSGAATLSGTLNITSTSGIKTFNDIIVNSTGIWNNSANLGITVTGNIQNDGTLTAGSGIYTLSGVAKTISGTNGVEIPTINMSGTYTNNVTAAIGLTVNTDLGGATGALTQGTNAILKIGGAAGIGTLTASVNPNTVYYTSITAGQTIKLSTYHHLIIDKTGQTATLGGIIACNGNLTITTGTFQLSTFNCTVSGTTYITGTIDDNSATGTNSFAGINMTGGTINTSTATTISATSLTIPSGTNTISGTLGNIAVSGAVNITGTLNISASSGTQSFGDVTINAIGNYTNSGNTNVTITGNFTNIGTFTSGSGIYTFSGIAKTLSGASGFTITNADVTGIINFDCNVESFFANLTITNKLTILKDRALTINTSFTNNGTILVDAGPNGHSGSLITPTTFTNNGTCSFITSIAKNNWHGISSPVTNAQIETVFSDLASHNNNFYYYNEANATGYWIQQTTGALTPGKGFYTYYFSNKYKTYSGTFNNGNIAPITITYSAGGRLGWNFVGNPYPSAIDWNAAGWTKTNLKDAVYVRNGAAWESFVGGIGSCRYIYPGQGFFVVANSGGGTLGFSNSIRLHRPTDNLKSTNNIIAVEDPVLHLTLSNETYSNNTYIRFKNDATTGFDDNWDAIKFFSEILEYPEVFTVSTGNDSLSINSTPFTGIDTIIPLGIKIGVAGTYTLRATELLNFTSDYEVLLFDAVTNSWTDFKQDSTYSFYSDIYKGTNRFFMHFTRNPLTVSSVNYSRNLELTSPYCNETKLHFIIHNYLKSDVAIELLDLTGKPVYNNNISMNNTSKIISIHYSNFSAGYYILRVSNPVESIVKKVSLIK